jgi:hypothetical protein
MPNIIDTPSTVEYGFIYILKNQWMPGIVKIGKTINIRERMNTLYNTSVPSAFRGVYIAKILRAKMDEAEHTLHLVFAEDRVNPRREFFQMDDDKIDNVIRILKLIEVEDVTDDVNGDVRTSLPPEEEQAWEENTEMVRRARRPNLNFHLLGIENDERLYWKDDETIFVTVSNERKVNYNGTEMSLTRATQTILGNSAPIQPSPYWFYNGRLLSDIYNEYYTPMDSSVDTEKEENEDNLFTSAEEGE